MDYGTLSLRKRLFSPVHIGAYIRELHFWRELRHLPVLKFRRVLDAGCGPGVLAMKLARCYAHMEVVGYDLKSEFIKDNLPSNFRLEHRNLLDLREREKYDFVYSIDVLEHIPDNERVVENIWYALKDGGYFFLHMPRDNSKKRIFPKRFFREFDSWCQKEHIGEQYQLKEAMDMLEKHGFRIFTATESFGYFGRMAWELDRVTDGIMPLKIAVMPFLKVLARWAVVCPVGPGGILLVGRKTGIARRVNPNVAKVEDAAGSRRPIRQAQGEAVRLRRTPNP